MESGKKTCPHCGEEIMANAKKCKWCGEWLNEEAHSSYISCPTCGEHIPEDSKICPLCHEPVSTSGNNMSTPLKSPARPTSKGDRLPLYIVGGIVALVLLVYGGVKLKSYLNDREYQKAIEESPGNVISKNLEEAIERGENLSQFLRDEKNVAALKRHFGEDVYSIMLKLGVYSDEPLTSNDPEDYSSGGYAWRSPGEKGQYGCRLYLTQDALGCKYYYEGFEVDQYGMIVTNPKWEHGYYKDDFNEDVTSMPYIEQYFRCNEENGGFCRIRIDNYWGISFSIDNFYYDQILLRNDDGEVWSLPIEIVSSKEAVLKREGVEQFTRWFHTSKSIKLSASNSKGEYNPSTVTLDKDDMNFYATFMFYVEGKRINSDIFIDPLGES